MSRLSDYYAPTQGVTGCGCDGGAEDEYLGGACTCDVDCDCDGECGGACPACAKKTGAAEAAVLGGAGALVKGAAAFGRVYSVIGACIGLVIAVICIYLGYAKIRDPHSATTTATVTSVQGCTPSAMQGGGPTCIVAASYTVGGAAYTATNLSVTQAAAPAVGSAIPISYDPADPQSAVAGAASPAAGWAIVAFGLLVGGVTTGIAVMTFKSESFAAGYGAVEGISMVAHAL